MKKYNGDYTKINTFRDLCEDLKDIGNFNYFHSYLEDEAFRTIKGIKLTDKNYPKALKVLRRRYGNKKRIISAHMNELSNIKKVESDRNLQGLDRLYDDIESHVGSLQSLDVDDNNYGSLFTSIIIK